ncbi:hypothetical protein [Subtercola lobariae]|uniref:hypothetical protein n=1 Tax=Subtercola lobariae TaxID=1588641 RepID=UPI00166B8AD6|nr:hypothetical protein [Subtercola lobariae]
MSVPNTTFTAVEWGSGVSAKLSGLDENTQYSVSIDSRYKGETKTAGGYFSLFSTPVNVTTNAAGEATITWTPDTFPQNYTDSGESGFLLGAYVRVDPTGGPVVDSSPQGFADPIALSNPLQIQFLPFDQVTFSAQACIEPDQLLTSAPGMRVTLSGLVPREWVAVTSHQTGGPSSFGFAGYGHADDSGQAVIILHGSFPDYPVSPSNAIAPGEWQLVWGGNYRVAPPPGTLGPATPIQIGNCP